MVRLPHWAGRERAEALRHWPTLVFVAEQIERSKVFEALILVGSFAKGTCDEASDLDLMVAVDPGNFDDAWACRSELEPPGVQAVWDFFPHRSRPSASRKFITRDVVKVEIGISDPAAANAKLADPYHVLIGDPEVATRYARLEPIPDEVLEAYAHQLRESGVIPDVEMRYGDLMRAIRAHRHFGEVPPIAGI